MKIAIILSGQPRSWEMCKLFHKNIMNYNECDVILSIDKNNNSQLLYQNNTDELDNVIVEKIISFYKPVSYYISSETDEKQIALDCSLISNHNCILYSYDDNINDILISNYLLNQDSPFFSDSKPLKIHNTLYKGNNKINGLLVRNNYYCFIRQYYFLNKCYELLNNHINKTNAKYDIIIRIRFDHILWNTNIDIKELMMFEKNDSDNNIKYTDNNIQIAELLTRNKIINVDIPEINTIKVLGGGIYKNYTYINDYFWTHGQDLISKMITFYLELIKITNDAIINGYPQYGATIEHFFSVFLSNQQLIIKKTLMNNGTIIRTK